jgi:NADPH-dependent 7-cyano-7-deazaguanine reductase QueF
MLRDISPIGLRVTPELKLMIRAAAKKNGRSMNSEMLARLAASFDTHVDLHEVTTGELLRELVDRNEPDKHFSIEVKVPIVK